MKHCLECDKQFDDLLELCPECSNVLVLGKRRTRSTRPEQTQGGFTAAGDPAGANRVLYSGSRGDVEYLKSILDTQNLHSTIERGSAGQWDLSVSPLYAEAAEELLEDIYPSAHRYETFRDMEDLERPFADFDRQDKFRVDTFGTISKISMLVLFSILTVLAIFGVYAIISFFVES